VDEKSGCGNGGEDESKAKKEDAIEVLAEFSFGDEPRIGKKERRDEKRKKCPGIQMEIVEGRRKAQNESGQDQKSRLRDAPFCAKGRNEYDEKKEPDGD
jgi:hypothetical protein